MPSCERRCATTSRFPGHKQWLSVKEIAQRPQRSKADSCDRFVADRRAGNRIEHPLGNQASRSVGHDDDHAGNRTAPLSCDNLDFLAMKRMVMIVNGACLRNVSSA
jgi:hypothetical protein